MSLSIDNIFYENNKLGKTLILRARRSMFDLFMMELKPNSNSKIIDVGISLKENEVANFLEKNYPWKKNISCAGLGYKSEFKLIYPGLKYYKIEANKRLPFTDNQFDIAYSSAVIEHVGGAKERIFYISEMIRISKAIIITCPNRFFPIEHHTSLPLLHFSPYLFRKLLQHTWLRRWANPKLLDFIGKKNLLREWPEINKPKLIYCGLKFGIFSSNIALIYRKN